jgi:hypothetical protein
MNRNLVGSMYGRSSIEIANFVLIVNKHERHMQFLFLIGQFLKKSFPLKLLGQMHRNLAGSIYGRSAIKMLISFCSINKHGRHRQFLFLIGQFLIFYGNFLKAE